MPCGHVPLPRLETPVEDRIDIVERGCRDRLGYDTRFELHTAEFR
jgi:hypothetical protein